MNEREIEMDMPLMAQDINLNKLRKIHRGFVDAENCNVTIIFMCDDNQLEAASKVPGYLAREKYGDSFTWKRPAEEVGFCENFFFRPK